MLIKNPENVFLLGVKTQKNYPNPPQNETRVISIVVYPRNAKKKMCRWNIIML